MYRRGTLNTNMIWCWIWKNGTHMFCTMDASADLKWKHTVAINKIKIKTPTTLVNVGSRSSGLDGSQNIIAYACLLVLGGACINLQPSGTPTMMASLSIAPVLVPLLNRAVVSTICWWRMGLGSELRFQASAYGEEKRYFSHRVTGIHNAALAHLCPTCLAALTFNPRSCDSFIVARISSLVVLRRWVTHEKWTEISKPAENGESFSISFSIWRMVC